MEFSGNFFHLFLFYGQRRISKIFKFKKLKIVMKYKFLAKKIYKKMQVILFLILLKTNKKNLKTLWF